jgi:hypothetical protein
MNRYKYLALPTYLVAFALVVIPFFDASMQIGSFNPGNEQWRFGALGLMSNAFMVPAIGLLIALVVALLLGHWRFLRVLGSVCGLGAVVLLALFLLFALDAIQTRGNVQPAARFSFVVASFTAAGKLLLAMVTLAAIARTGLKTAVAERPRI